MLSDRLYELCEPTLRNAELGEEEKTDALEELLGSPPHSLKGKALEDAVLGALWRWKSANETHTHATKPALIVAPHKTVRSRSPAAWLQHRTSTASVSSSPRQSANVIPAAPGFEPQHAALSRTKSSTASPYASPKASPRLSASTPAFQQSPRMNASSFGDSSPFSDPYGEYGSDTADWFVNDETSSNTSYGDAGFAASSEYMASFATEMTPYDMLRSILQDSRSDEELEQCLEANGWDLSQTVNSLMEAQALSGVATAQQQSPQEPRARTYMVGKSMSPTSRPVTPATQAKSPIVCRYWLMSGHCARADCRFAHSIENHVCKFWLQGGCLAGETCQFSHDPMTMMQQLSIANSGASSPQQLGTFQMQDDSFPALQPSTSNPYDDTPPLDPSTLRSALHQQQQHSGTAYFPTFVPSGPRNASRPGSRHTSRAATPTTQPNFNDDEAFPSLGSAAMNKSGKRHHGKRGGHGHHAHATLPVQPSSLADVVRMSPSPATSPAPTSRDALRRGLRNNRSFTSSREQSNAALSIPAPKEIPWLETGEHVNKAYLSARAEAVRHGGLRNKFLQSAAQAWNRNDARGAKALSLRGQNENQLMKAAHREAAQVLYEERNKRPADGRTRELYVDLHGLHPEEAVSYLQDCLKEHASSTRPVYAITGTGHHSKNGKDKVGKAIRQFLIEWRYAFREFSVPGDRNNVGGILGIDPSSFDKEIARKGGPGLEVLVARDSGVDMNEAKKESSKVLLVREDPRTVAAVAVSPDEIEVLESGA